MKIKVPIYICQCGIRTHQRNGICVLCGSGINRIFNSLKHISGKVEKKSKGKIINKYVYKH